MANCYQYYRHVPLAQRIARWTSNPKVLGSIPRWDDSFFFSSFISSLLLRASLGKKKEKKNSFSNPSRLHEGDIAQWQSIRLQSGRSLVQLRVSPYVCSLCTFLSSHGMVLFSKYNRMVQLSYSLILLETFPENRSLILSLVEEEMWQQGFYNENKKK